MKLANFFTKERCKAGISQRSLASSLGVHHSYISQIEAGDKPLPAQLALDMCSLFRIDPGTLFDEGGPFDGALILDQQGMQLVQLFRRIPERDRAAVLKTVELMAASGHPAKVHKPNRD